MLTTKKAKEIAENSFGLVLDCIMGYSDEGYNLDTSVDEFEENFIEDLEAANITATTSNLIAIKTCYDDLIEEFKLNIKEKYYKVESNSTPIEFKPGMIVKSGLLFVLVTSVGTAGIFAGIVLRCDDNHNYPNYMYSYLWVKSKFKESRIQIQLK